MNHPYQSLHPAARRRWLGALLLACLGMLLVFQGVGAPLTTPAAPYGIVSFELAFTSPRAVAILDSWDTAARVSAGFVQGIDYLFLLLYPTTLALGCVMAGAAFRRAGWLGGRLAAWAAPLAWAMMLMSLFDALENGALLIMLFGDTGAPWPQLGAGCAALKFILLFAGLVYALLGLAANYLKPKPA